VADGPAEPETLTEAQTDQAPREASTLVTRAASLGLAGVVLCLAVFSILGAYRMQTQTESRAIQGTGLGLPIVRQIVLMCAGKVWATSETGRGSVFHVELPLMEAASQGSGAA